MVEKKDEGKRCRLVRDGGWGSDNLRIHGEEAFNKIFRIVEVYESSGDLFVRLDQIYPKAPDTQTWYAERVELISDNELDILT